MQHANAASKNSANIVDRYELEINYQAFGGGEVLSSIPFVRSGTIE